jgi:hypothetical protein
MTPNRADRMQLLARVETARESRRRSELAVADDRLQAATASAVEAANRFECAREERRQTLSRLYADAVGQRRSTYIRGLRETEEVLAWHQETALQGSNAAEAARLQAAAERDEAQDALRAASMRAMRRGRMADTLKQQEKHAAMIAEEEQLADEVLERIAGAVGK